MSAPVLQVLDAGLSATLQDQGRPGWRRYGVPVGGALDDHAASLANRLLGNPPWSAVLELMLQGARLQAVEDVWVAVTGALAGANFPFWRTLKLEKGQQLSFPRAQAGVWTYVAVEGGFAAPLFLDSASTLASAGLGRPVKSGDILCRDSDMPAFPPPGVKARVARFEDQRDYLNPPALRVFPGPQWADFAPEDREALFIQPWHTGPHSSRVGYRLEGEATIPPPPGQMISEPVRLGTIQVPESGRPIVLLRDGPTVGGYAKIGLVHPEDLSWLVQCRPGQEIMFRPA